jgi:hypothetical protein
VPAVRVELEEPVNVAFQDDRRSSAMLTGILVGLGVLLAVMVLPRLREAGGVIGPILLGCAGLVAAVPVFLALQRRRWIRRFDGEGIVLRGGRRLAWSSLRSIHRRMGMRHGERCLSHYELIFEEGKTYVFPARVLNAGQVSALVERLATQAEGRP